MPTRFLGCVTIEVRGSTHADSPPNPASTLVQTEGPAAARPAPAPADQAPPDDGGQDAAPALSFGASEDGDGDAAVQQEAASQPRQAQPAKVRQLLELW